MQREVGEDELGAGRGERQFLRVSADEMRAAAVLEDAGARWEDLVDVTVFLTDMGRDFATFNRLYAEYFAGARPCRTTVEVTALPTPIAIELKCIAEVRSP